jgi:hypothetical protein
MLAPQYTTKPSEWVNGIQAWDAFTDRHPELGLNKGKWPFHNFLRPYRQALVEADAIRLVRNRFWLAHQDRFFETAFECATGRFHEAVIVQAPALAHALKNPALIEQPQKAKTVMCQGLTAQEFFRLKQALPLECLEQVLEQNARLQAAHDAVVEAWPSWVWNAEAMSETDLQRMDKARLALLEACNGQL